MAPRQARSDTRRAIIESAQSLMAHRGYAAVGLNDLLAQAGVPKGSFYHYFSSKDAFGAAMMHDYFVDYLAKLDRTLGEPEMSAAQRLTQYFIDWTATQSADDFQGGCLFVKLGAEVADLSESMRDELQSGIGGIIDRLERAIDLGIADGSIVAGFGARATAELLLDVWIGASTVAKIDRSGAPLSSARAATQHLLSS